MASTFCVAKTWKGPDKGFPRKLTREGGDLDPTPGSLTISPFVLFAFSWFHKATKDQAARDWMHRTLDFIETHMRHPKAGFWNEKPPAIRTSGWRQQNPHMHLTEACLAAFEATGERALRTSPRRSRSSSARGSAIRN